MALGAGGSQSRIRGTGVGIEGRKLLKVLEGNVDLGIPALSLVLLQFNSALSAPLLASLLLALTLPFLNVI